MLRKNMETNSFLSFVVVASCLLAGYIGVDAEPRPDGNKYRLFHGSNHQGHGDDDMWKGMRVNYGEALPGSEANSVVLVNWVPFAEKTAETLAKKYSELTRHYVTVGTVIAKGVILASPHGAIKAANEKEAWAVHSLTTDANNEETQKTVEGKDLEDLVLHTNIKTDKDATDRVVVITFTAAVVAAHEHLVPLHLVKDPLTIPGKIHQDLALTGCMMVVHVTEDKEVKSVKGPKLSGIPMVATRCMHSAGAKDKFENRVCGYTKMTKEVSDFMSNRFMHPGDMGAPLICNSLLVGMFSGIQNLDGDFYAKSKLKDVDFEEVSMIGRRQLGKNEQYTFYVPEKALGDEPIKAKTAEAKTATFTEYGDSDVCIDGALE